MPTHRAGDRTPPRLPERSGEGYGGSPGGWGCPVHCGNGYAADPSVTPMHVDGSSSVEVSTGELDDARSAARLSTGRRRGSGGSDCSMQGSSRKADIRLDRWAWVECSGGSWGGLGMTDAEQAWSEDARVDGPPRRLSIGAAAPAARAPAVPRRARSDAADVAEMTEQVRIRVRDSGVDPQRDSAEVRRIAENVANAHDERSLTGAVAPLENLPALVDDLVARVSGFGPLQQYLDDPAIEEVWINEPSRVFVARHGRHELTPTILTGDEVRELVERMLKTSGRRLDLSQPFVDALLPGGHRLHVVLEGISRDFAAVKTAVKKTTSRLRTRWYRVEQSRERLRSMRASA